MRMPRTICCCVLLTLAGCATVPMGPSVRVMPAPGKSFEQFQVDDAVCRQWAGQQIGMTPQETVNQNAVTDAVNRCLLRFQQFKQLLKVFMQF